MINVKGFVRGVFRDVNTGEITREMAEVENHIQDDFLTRFYRSTYSIPGLGANLFVSTYNPGKQTRKIPYTFNTENSVQGVNISGISSTVLSQEAEGVYLITKTQRINPPEEDFTINSIGLCTGINTNTTTGVKTVNSVTNFVWLEDPCVQKTTESLDLFYRIQILYDEDYYLKDVNSRSLNRIEAYTVARALADQSDNYLIYNYSWNSYIPCVFSSLSKVNSRSLDKLRIGNNTAYIDYKCTLDDRINEEKPQYFKSSMEGTMPLENDIGKIISHIGNDWEIMTFKVNDPSGNPVQSIFGHRDNSNTPFYKSTSSPLGLGSIEVNGDNWTNPDHPKYVRINVTTDGISGVGEYNFRISNCYGFDGNTFDTKKVDLPWSFPENAKSHKNLDLADPAAYPMYFYKNTILLVKVNEVIKVKVLSGEVDSIDNSTVFVEEEPPKFLATDIGQVAVASNNDFYVSCRDTGLYKLNQDMDTITVIDSSVSGLSDTSGCYGVAIGLNGRVWAYFAHTTQNSLYYSDDSGATWTKSSLADATLDTKIRNIVSLSADINNDELAVVYIEMTKDIDIDDNKKLVIKWWDNVNEVISQGPTLSSSQIDNATVNKDVYFTVGSSIGLQGLVSCSPINSTWVYGKGNTSYAPSLLTFGSSVETINSESYAFTYINAYCNWTVDASGQEFLKYTNYVGQAQSPQGIAGYHSVLYDPVTKESKVFYVKTSVGYYDSLFPIDDGIYLLRSANLNAGTSIFSLFDDSPYNYSVDDFKPHYDASYPEYGWDGNNWVKGHTGKKTIHSNHEELIDGVTVAFNDNGGTTPFLDSDHYTFGLVDGIWLDGFTTFDHYWEAYTKPTRVDTDTEFSVLPNNPRVLNGLIVKSGLESYVDDSFIETSTYPGYFITSSGSDFNDTAGLRSANPVIDGVSYALAPDKVSFVDMEDVSNIQGAIMFYVDDPSYGQFIDMTAGLSPITVIGTALNRDTIKYGFRVLANSGEDNTDAKNALLQVVEDGVVKSSIDNLSITSGGPTSENDSLKCRILVHSDRSVSYWYSPDQDSANYWIKLYQSAAGSIVREDLYFDMCFVRTAYTGVSNFYSWSLGDSDNYMLLGNGIDSGLNNPTFRVIDPESVVLTIDGSEAVNIGTDDVTSVLPANTYSVMPYSGAIRFSSDDIGKTVSAEYVTVSDE